MQQQESVLPGGITGEALAREVLTVEIREARDLLPADRMRSCEPYAVISIFDSSGRAIGTRKTNVVSGSLNPYWMERFEFQVTQWDKEGGYIEISLYDNCDNERLGYLRQPLFRLSETGAMEGWYFLDRPRYQSAALSVRMLLHPYRSVEAASGLAAPQGLDTGISARQPPAAAGIGVSGVGSRTPLGPTVYGTTGVVDAGFASPSGIPMGASPATATPIVGAPGVTPAVGPTMARHAGTAPLFIMRHRFWGLSNTYEVKDSQGLLLYRLIGNFGDKNDDIRIADASGHEVGYIREESSLIKRVYRMPSYLISVYGTSAKLKRKFLSLSEPIFSLRPFNAQSIHVKGNFAHTEFSFYQLDTIIADVSRGLAPPGDQGLYGVRVAPTFSNPLLILAAAVAIDRIHDVAGLRPISGVYSESRATLMSRVKRSKKKPVVVTTTAVPVATAAAPVTVTTTTAAATTAPIVTPVVASAPITRPVAATTTTVTPVATATAVPSVSAVPVAAASTNPFAAYYDERGIPTTPVVSVTTMSRDEGVPAAYAPAAASSATLAREEAMMQPRAELAARETMRQEAEQQLMQAERLELGAAAPPLHQEKERDQKVTQSELRQSQPVRIPIMGAGAFD